MKMERVVSRAKSHVRTLNTNELNQVAGGLTHTEQTVTHDPSDPTGGHDHMDGGIDF
jgi:bacteriocin-like protein